MTVRRARGVAAARSRPMHEQAPSLTGSIRPSATATTASTWIAGSPRSWRSSTRRGSRAAAGDGPRRPSRQPAALAGTDADQHGRRRLWAAVRHRIPAGRGRRPGRADAPAATGVAALAAAAEGIASLGKATAGEKTMLDALLPAVDAARAAIAAVTWGGRGARGGEAAAAGARQRSRCSRPRAGRHISASAASATRILARRRRHCCLRRWPTSPAAVPLTSAAGSPSSSRDRYAAHQSNRART